MQQFGGKDSKRHFTVVMGGKEHGLYVSSTPSSAAKKAVTKLCASNKGKKVEFHIREITQGSKKKTYGPYSGYIEKLKEPIELKGRVIKYKPVAKLSGKSGAKKGGMRGGNWIDKLDGYSPIEKNFMKEFERSLINKLKEKMNIRVIKVIKESLLRNIERSSLDHFEHIKEEIQTLSDERINELIKKVEDMLQDINMYETETWQQEIPKLGGYSENEKNFMAYFCDRYIRYMDKQLSSNNRNLNYSMKNEIKKSLKNSGNYSNIEEQRIDNLIYKVKIKYIGSLKNWEDGLGDIPEIERRFAKSAHKIIRNEYSSKNNTNLLQKKIINKNPEYSTIEKSRMNNLISIAKSEVNREKSMYN